MDLGAVGKGHPSGVLIKPDVALPFVALLSEVQIALKEAGGARGEQLANQVELMIRRVIADNTPKTIERKPAEVPFRDLVAHERRLLEQHDPGDLGDIQQTNLRLTRAFLTFLLYLAPHVTGKKFDDMKVSDLLKFEIAWHKKSGECIAVNTDPSESKEPIPIPANMAASIPLLNERLAQLWPNDPSARIRVNEFDE